MTSMQDALLDVEVAERIEETPEIARFVLVRPDGGALPAFTAGAHVDVRLNDFTRQYSLSNDPVERNRYEIAVLRDPESRGGSEAIHARVMSGDRITISAPRNHFELTSDDAPVALFAGGIGVTPILAMAEVLHRQGRPFVLHYAGRTASRMAFRDRLASAPYADRVHLHTDDGPEEQRLDAEKVIGELGSGGHVYVCGPTGFIDWICRIAQESGLPPDHIHREVFAAPEVERPAAEGSFEVEIASTGAVYEVGPDQTVIEVLEEHGIEIMMSCQQGICGSCITRVLSGEVIHNDFVLLDSEKEDGMFSPCCSRAPAGKRLVLDL